MNVTVMSKDKGTTTALTVLGNHSRPQVVQQKTGDNVKQPDVNEAREKIKKGCSSRS
jgi:hypothetical protein